VKKTKVYCVASAIAVSAVTNPMMNVLAENTTPVKQETTNTVQTITITTQDFINTYLSTKKTVKVNNKDTVQYNLITVVDETNFGTILQGNDIFTKLKTEQQTEIKNTYETAYKNLVKETTKRTTLVYDIVVENAKTINTNIQNSKNALQTVYDGASTLNGSEYTSTSFKALQDALTASKTILDANNSTLTVKSVDDSKTALETAKLGLVKIVDLVNAVNEYKNTLEETKQSGLTQSCYDNAKTVIDAASAVVTSATSQSEVDNALSTLNAYFEDGSHFEYEVAEPAKAAPVEQKVETPTTTENKAAVVTEEKTVESKSEETIVAPILKQTTQEQVNVQTSTDTTATNFVSNYLTSSSGNIFASANNLNASKILSGLTTWTKLSQTQKDSVNSILLSNGSKRYTALVQEAQKLNMSTKTYSKVNTSTSTNTGFYAMLSAISLGMFGLLTKRMKKED
jgi:hypothetical protein